MAKIQANTVSGGSFSQANAPYAPTSAASVPNITGALGAAFGAEAGVYGHQARLDGGLADLAIRQNARRTQGLISGLNTFGSGIMRAGANLESAWQRRADEDAETALAEFSEYMRNGQEADYATPVSGNACVDLNDPSALGKVSGPYMAVSARMDEWLGGERAVSLSRRAMDAFLKKSEPLRERLLSNALNAQVASDKAKRKATEGANYAEYLRRAQEAVCDTTNPDIGQLFQAADEAIGYNLGVTARNMGIVGEDGSPIDEDGAKIYGQLKSQTGDEVFRGLIGALAERAAATEDEEEAKLLRDRLAVFSIKSVTGMAEEEPSLEEEGQGEENSDVQSDEAKVSDREAELDAILGIGKAADGDSEEARSQRLSAKDELVRAGNAVPVSMAVAVEASKKLHELDSFLERKKAAKERALASEALRLEYLDFTRGEDAWQETLQLESIKASLPPEAQAEIAEKRKVWEAARRTAAYDDEIASLSSLPIAEQLRRGAEILKRANAESNLDVRRHVRARLGAEMPKEEVPAFSSAPKRPDGYSKYTHDSAIVAIKLLGLKGEAAMDWASNAQNAGYFEKGVFGKVYESVLSEAMSEITIDEIADTLGLSGLSVDLSKLVEIGENGVPLCDKDGKMIPKDSGGRTKLFYAVGADGALLPSASRMPLESRGYSSSNPILDARYGKPKSVKVANEVLYRAMEAAMMLKALQKAGDPRARDVKKFYGEALSGVRQMLSEEIVRNRVSQYGEEVDMLYRRGLLKSRGVPMPNEISPYGSGK